MDYNNKNSVINSEISADGDLILGDNVTKITINLKEAAEYRYLEESIQKLRAQSKITKEKIERYPDDEDFKTILIEISRDLNIKEKEVSELMKSENCTKNLTRYH